MVWAHYENHPVSRRDEMSEGKGAKQKWGDSLVELFIPKKPEQSTEQIAEGVADEVEKKIREALVETVQPSKGLKKELADELIKRARSLAYSLALREIGLPKNKAKSAGQDEEAIKEIGKWLVTITGVRGSPKKKRESGIKALDMKLSGMTWMELTPEICDCGNSEHYLSCKERIRHQAFELSKLLRKYKIGDVPPLNQDRSEMIKQGKLQQRESQERRKNYLP